ncbi:MAG: metal ABC transporter permease [Rhodovarius sp.]|nr:metal ABC transporter permease [Rhodovarius sp.]MDW8315322.1 metal ABC transporter permease [Rhodovarius sp.]
MAAFLQLDAPALLAALLAGATCGLLGSFLLLRREALLGDAIAHAVLPGIVAAFAITGARSGLPMLVGAAAAALLAAWLIGQVRRLARLEGGAASGIVFTAMFSAGIVGLEVTGGRDVHLDVHHVLFGQMETLLWPEATGLASLFDPAALAALPPGLWLLLAVALMVAGGVALLWRPLMLMAFDPLHARVVGLPVGRLELLLHLMVAAAAVAAFEAVGSILVVALLIAPAAAMRFLTDRYAVQVLGGAALGAGVAVAGYLLAGPLPMALGAPAALNAAGVVGVLAAAAVPAAMWLGRRGQTAARLASGTAGADPPGPGAPVSRPGPQG